MGILSREKHPLQQLHSKKGVSLFSGDYGNGMLGNQCNTHVTVTTCTSLLTSIYISADSRRENIPLLKKGGEEVQVNTTPQPIVI